MRTEDRTYKSTCCYCGTGCGVEINRISPSKIEIEGDRTHPVNKGMLCSKGLNLHHTVNDRSDRLLYPQMRHSKSSPLQRCSWDQALNRAAATFKSIIRKYGPEAVAFYVSGQCLTEEYYLWNKLMKGFIGSNNIDTNSRLCMSSAVVGYKKSLGEDSVPVCYDDIELSDCILVTGANPAWCHPIIWRRVEAHKAANPHVKIICVDPRKTQTANSADLHIGLLPGTDVFLHNAIARELIENQWIDQAFIADHVEGFDEYKSEVFSQSIEEYAANCGISTEEIKTVAQWIAQAKGFLSMWTMGLNQSVIGVNKNLSLISLSLITGKIGKPGNGPFSLTGQPNAMGGREVGGLSNMLASHRELSNPQHIAEMEELWGVSELSTKPGLSATEMFEALDSGKLKAIWISCTNPMVSLPNVQQAEAALKKAPFVVVQEISNKSDSTQFADVLLPAAAWTEKEGTMTNAERRISLLEKVIEPPGECLPDAEIICRFAQKMDWEDWFSFSNSEAIYNEYKKTTAGTRIDCTGVSYNSLRKKTIQWPYPSSGTETHRLFEDHKFYTPSGKARLFPTKPENHSEPQTKDFPLILLTGRVRDQWHTQTKTGKVNRLKQHLPTPFVEIHPQDAQTRNIVQDQLVEICGRRGKARVKAQLSEEVKPGTCFMPMHWGKIKKHDLARANNLTSPLVDPISKEPDFKFAAVELRPYKKNKEKILVIGAGSASLGFISTYRKFNQSDEIEVFSKEIHPFYNRVMLPDYVSGTQNWKQLIKLREDEFAVRGIKVHKGVSIADIDRKHKVVVDSEGQEHRYDKLFLGMGSRAFMPSNFPKIPGIFNMRSRLDADALAPFISTGGRAIIVGGGLLGLEMAASLRQINVPVTVVQRIGRFMDRQLDPLGSSILHEEIEKLGIEVYYNNEVEQFFGTKHLEAVRLKSGHKIDCSLLIVAAGTRPNIELAQKAKLQCQRGILVNDYLQTSDPDIFACGEIAQWQDKMWGITAAAEQQAEVAAGFLAGDITQPYSGSLSMNILKIEGLNLCSLGEVEIPKGATDYEEVVFIDKAKHYYKKCLIRNDRLVGAILIGDKSEFLEFKELISKQIELSEKRLQLLRSGQKAEATIGKLICSCNNVGEGNIKAKIKGGCKDFAQLCEQTGAGTGCGSCRSEVRSILEETSREIEIKVLQ
ncbi:molybdopterin-dependent oxidoreductase [Marinilongibacter aquaticus]|uniref:nitrate reductase n=1 Tax=Marinilongibacter aquaticus TaxID=2975157 RepID=UPI0021BDA710|nr:nitrate reductase [Marinilongibacter aquaticus]UBM57353.1 molybdopterin-dependent oxidoreductase [Marinilongibacter aquaticus]